MSYGVYWSILQGVQASIQAVVSVNVVIRKKIILLEEDTLPIIILAPAKENIRMQEFNRNVSYEYPVHVVYIQGDSRQVSAGLNVYLATREQIRNQLYQVTLPGVAAVWDTNIDIDEAFQYEQYFSTNYDCAAWVPKYSSAELRTS
jgi:hypothetical protein